MKDTNIKAVLFDMDGLMFDTEKLSTQAYIKAAEKQGYKMSVEETHLVLGFNVESTYKFFEQYFEKLDNGVDGKKLVDYHYEYIENILYTKGPDKMPYLEELLDYLKENNYKIAVASSSDLDHIKNNLEKTEVKHYIDVIASGEEVKNGKPAPDVFLLAAERLNISPENCLVLEDSKFGIQAANSANMRVIMVPDSIKPDEEIKKLTYKIVANLSEVVTILENNNEN